MLGTIDYLSIVLCFGYTISPYVSNYFFLKNSKIYKQIYYPAIVSVFLSVWGILPQVSVLWLFYSSFGFFLYFKIHKKDILRNKHWLGLVPFLFSLVSATWFVCGTNDLYLLGYNKTWSFYASIHGCFIGWLFLSGICSLAIKNSKLQILTVFVGLVLSLFLVIAIGIDQSGPFKKIGVIGYMVLFPVIALYILKVLKPKRSISKFFLWIHFFSILFSLCIAVGKEFSLFDVDHNNLQIIMHYLHGGINAFVVIPTCLFAIFSEENVHTHP
ncbi:hypothetical protein [Leptospira jelokensis]|uniref:Uncharacterized protein n=1 Tax=Leptospira jelokensis TaxID=2484931 RepID=A0A4Z1A8E6_9LEPT|nr:hypothetical protein [Leptospira jelokensis]TGL72118.1 hypothetical protein EHQ62_04575 [Leptospira jelokensis]